MTNEGKIIGIHGPKGSGKSTAAQHLVHEHGWERIAFADPVKELAYNVAPKPVRRLVDLAGWDRLKQYGPFRRYLQRVGTDGVRDVIGEGVWVNVAHNRIQKLLATGHNIVVDDVRFPNEADTIHHLGGTMVGIVSNHGGDDDHPSEQVLDSIDRWVDARRCTAKEFLTEFTTAITPILLANRVLA